MIKLEPFQKHIVLYCKGQYDIPNGDKGFFDGLKMIWAIRCGYDYEHTSKDTLTYIANDMYNIISQCMPKRLPHLIENLHREINWSIGKPKNLEPIEAIIWEYRSMLSCMQVRERNSKGKLIWLVDLRNTQPQLFNRILKGKGKYDDYRKVK